MLDANSSVPAAEPKLANGFYWVHLRYRLTAHHAYDGWQVCHYQDGVWEACGTEIELDPSVIVEIDLNRLERSNP